MPATIAFANSLSTISGLPASAQERIGADDVGRGFVPGMLAPAQVIVARPGIASETAGLARFEAELRKTNSNVEFVLYPGAPHAFFSDDRPQVYKKDAAEDAWKRCLAFFDKHLKS